MSQTPTQAPWRSLLARALYRNRSLPNARYVQLATVRPDGTPANRTLVFRGFVPDQFVSDQFVSDRDELQFVSDRRSEKIHQIQHHDHHQNRAMGEICWYFPKTREQFRLLGALRLVTNDTADLLDQKLRRMLWQGLSDNARLQFAWPDPGQERATPEAFQIEPPDERQPLPNFCVLLHSPIQVDHLELRGEPQNRCLYCLDGEIGQWSMSAINP